MGHTFFKTLIMILGAFCVTACGSPAADSAAQASPQSVLPAYPDKINPPPWMLDGGKAHYAMRLSEIAALDPIEGGVMLLGDSITEAWQWHDFPFDGPLTNHGIGWDVTEGAARRMGQVFQNRPDVAFIMIGTNDLSYGLTPEQIAAPLDAMLNDMTRQWPNTKIYVQSVLPRNGEFELDVGALNATYKAMIDLNGGYGGRVHYIDLVPAFSAAPEVLRPELSDDGLHLNAAGYALWAEQIAPYLPQ